MTGSIMFHVPRRLVLSLLSLAFSGLALAALPSGAAAAPALDLSAYKGKVVYLDFWASWCTPCRQSFPWMNDLETTYGRDGLVVIAINVDHDHELAEDFLQDNSANFKVLYDPNGRIASQFNFRDMPTSYLIGRDGKIHYVHNGFYPNREGEYLSHIQTLLNERPS
ncbi:MAG: TlpA family protein disulfide reductase [Alphaproteobacteria bacterium]|nr:TlpA family protein disulfide reductase [Alphaproteobacteria bacterium]MDE2011778.1 TlpA family protein disulfide reductase [Alphaproteobacteria bacterium]MDE2073820.1 TlpA family protein disulfide reductase [Alphaproteobacteria bacterium]MDE2351953.1 TlpA family protein disulfide reductase [Alphaproteobacteria bacterium]